VLSRIKEYIIEKGSTNPADLISLFDDNIQSYLREITIEQYTLSHTWFERHPSIDSENKLYRYTIDLIKKYKQLHLEMKIAENQKAIESADSEEIAISLMKENQELERKRRELKIDLPG
ncbi:MAG: hypothetical protein ACUVT3_12595, partial [Ignavibacterium sp.]